MRKFLIAVFALLFWGGAWADLVARNGANELRLINSPCVHGGILGQLREEWRPKFKKAIAEINGKTHFACWVDTREGAYFIVWEDGTTALYSVTGFLDVPGV